MFDAKNRITPCLLGWTIFIGLGILTGCDSGEIQNWAGIEIESISRLNRVEVEIFLLNENGNSLLWNESIINPGIGLSIVNESEFKTNAKVYSMREGQQHTLIYDGRLIDLRWTRLSGSPIRLMTAEIPHALMTEDLERDTDLGVITVTVETEKQGPFEDTLRNTPVYGSNSSIFYE